MGDKAWKLLFGIWTAVCLGFVAYMFFETPAWDTGESDILPNGLGMFVTALVFTIVVWALGLLLLFVADQTVDSARRRRAHRVSR